MRKIRYVLIFSLLIITSGLLNAHDTAAFPRDVEWKQFHTEHFIIVFADQHRSIAEQVANLAESVHHDLAIFLNYTGDIETYVILTDEADTFNLYDLTLKKDPKNDPVVISLGQPQAEVLTFSSQTQDELFRQFVGQYSHILRHTMDGWWRWKIRYVFPDAGFSLWMNGGMAAFTEAMLHEESRPSLADMVLRTEALEDHLTSLSQQAALGRRAWSEELGGFAYGYNFMQYLSRMYGKERLAQLNREQSKTLPLPVFGKDAFQTVYGKRLKSLQMEWQEAIRQMYQAQLRQLQSTPVTQTQSLSSSGYLTNSPLFSPNGEYVYYIEDSAHDDPALMQLRLSDMAKTQLTEGNFSGNFSISSDGQQLFFSKTEIYKTFYELSDLYLLDLPTRKITRLTEGERAFDPAISPDGKTVVYSVLRNGSMSLLKMDLAGEQRISLLETSDRTQIRHPVFSADGGKIAFQIQKSGGSQEIHVMNSDGTNLMPIAPDASRDTSPYWGENDTYLFFSSNRTGVPNIFAYSLPKNLLYQVTNVLTGAFNPAVSPRGDQLAFEYYTAHGLEIHLSALEQQAWKPVPLAEPTEPMSVKHSPQLTQSPESGYNPLPSLFDLSYYPWGGEDEDGLQLGFNVNGEDVLGQHKYSVNVLYGLESGRVGFDAEYLNQQFYPTIRLFGYDTAVEFNDLFINPQGKDEEYWERQRGGGIELVIPLYRTRRTDVSLLTGYKYTQLDNLTSYDKFAGTLPDEGALANASAGLIIKSFDEYRYSISPESGIFAIVKYARDDEIFGSDFNINKLTGEMNVYVNSFFPRHVLAFKAAGGISDGDTLTQGVFQLGGSAFTMQSDLWYEPQFLLRGYEENSFAGDRVVLGSAEYRFPLWYPQHTIWDGRILVDSIAGTAFFEGGDAWDKDDDMGAKYSAGAELKISLGLRYGQMPLILGLGFAHGFDDDDGESQVYFNLQLKL